MYNDAAVKALFRGAPRGFAETHKNVLEPRLGAAYSMNDKTIVKVSGGAFHNRVTLNDSTGCAACSDQPWAKRCGARPTASTCAP